jgi:branched-chain amino acid transport system permease protein
MTALAPTAAAATCLVALVALLPQLAPNAYWVHVLTLGLVFAILAASWDLVYGIAGILSFGHAALFGVGGYAAALANLDVGMNPWLGLIFGGLVAAGLGILFSIASVRLRGTYLALSTLALAQAAQLAVSNFPSLTRGTLGLSGYDGLPGIQLQGHGYYYVTLAIGTFFIGGLYCVVRFTGIGLAWRAMRNDPLRASTLGMAVAPNRLIVFVTSSFMAGVAGAIYADYVTVMSPAELDASLTAMVIAMAIIGGAGTLIGPAIAGLVIESSSEGFRFLGGTRTGMAIGALLIVFVLGMPGGFAELASRVRGLVRRSHPNGSATLEPSAGAEHRV